MPNTCCSYFTRHRSFYNICQTSFTCHRHMPRKSQSVVRLNLACIWMCALFFPKWSVYLCSTLQSTSLHHNGLLLRGADAWMALQIKWRHEAQLMAAFQYENVASDFCKHEPFSPLHIKAQNRIVLQIWMNCIQMLISVLLWAVMALLLLQIYHCLISQICYSVHYALMKFE